MTIIFFMLYDIRHSVILFYVRTRKIMLEDAIIVLMLRV